LAAAAGINAMTPFCPLLFVTIHCPTICGALPAITPVTPQYDSARMLVEGLRPQPVRTMFGIFSIRYRGQQ
jgi:hypothetical protein